jgi:hypothetical protein
MQLVFNLEAKLAGITVPNDELRDPRETYNPHTVKEVCDSAHIHSRMRVCGFLHRD